MINLVQVPRAGRPKGFKCHVCDRAMKPGEIAVFAQSRYDRFAIHKECMELLLQGSPVLKEHKLTKAEVEDLKYAKEFEEIREKYAKQLQD